VPSTAMWGQKDDSRNFLPQQLTLDGLRGPTKALRVSTGSLGPPLQWLAWEASSVWSEDHSSPMTGEEVSSALRSGT
jgi:hypothetical protein